MSSIIIQAVMYGVSLAMDALSVSISDGIILKKPRFCEVMKIALFFAVFQFIMPVIGFFAGTTFASVIESCDHYVAFALLAIIGSKMLYEAIKGKDDENTENPLSIKTLTVLAIATSIDALAVGVTFAVVATPVLLSSAIIGIVTFVICTIGVYIGSRCGDILGSRAEIAGGVILILIGLKILLEHTIFQ